MPEDPELKPLSLNKSASKESHGGYEPLSTERNTTSQIPKPKVISFFNGFLNHMLSSRIHEILSRKANFLEFHKKVELPKNLENLIYLEENHENKLKTIFLNSYENMFQKIKENAENSSMGLESLIVMLHSNFCKLLGETFELIQSCTNDYCFELLKK